MGRFITILDEGPETYSFRAFKATKQRGSSEALDLSAGMYFLELGRSILKGLEFRPYNNVYTSFTFTLKEGGLFLIDEKTYKGIMTYVTLGQLGD